MAGLNVLITGAASGIGRAAAELFVSRGDHVIAIDKSDIGERENLVGFAADITDEASLNRVRRYLSENKIELDAILCIAGIHQMASFVEDDYEKMKRLIDVNLSGTVLTNRVFHSSLKKSGRIVILTSEVATYSPMPFNGLYNVSKTALECYAKALRQELNLIGQRVVTVRPGAIETPLERDSLSATEALAERTVLYKKQSRHFANIVRKFSGKPMKPEKLAQTIYKAATVKRPRLSYCKHRSPGLVLLSLLPDRAQCAIIKKLLSRK